MSELLLAVSLITSGALGIVTLVLWKRVIKLSKSVMMILQAANNMMKALQDLSAALEAQNGLNQEVNRNLEILGVHTRLLKPTIGFEAESFLANYNRKKREENG